MDLQPLGSEHGERHPRVPVGVERDPRCGDRARERKGRPVVEDLLHRRCAARLRRPVVHTVAHRPRGVHGPVRANGDGRAVRVVRGELEVVGRHRSERDRDACRQPGLRLALLDRPVCPDAVRVDAAQQDPGQEGRPDRSRDGDLTLLHDRREPQIGHVRQTAGVERHRGTQSDVIEGVCDDREEAHATAEIDRGCGGIGGTGGGKQGQARTEGEGSLRHVGADTTNADQRVVDPRAAPATVRGRLPRTSARNRPVCESGSAATSSGVPTATTFPP